MSENSAETITKPISDPTTQQLNPNQSDDTVKSDENVTPKEDLKPDLDHKIEPNVETTTELKKDDTNKSDHNILPNVETNTELKKDPQPENNITPKVTDSDHQTENKINEKDSNTTPTTSPLKSVHFKDSSDTIKSNEATVTPTQTSTPKESELKSDAESELKKVESNSGTPKRELKKDDAGNKTFTMRELLDELKSSNADKEQERSDIDTASPFTYSRETTQQQIDENNAAMDLINSVTGADEEGRSRQKILTFAARRYASAIERNPDDYDALYNWALVLQESADNVGPETSSSAKDALLEEACKKYEEATRLCPTLHDAYYNRAIAISDRAKMRGRTKEAEELWKQATFNYEKAVQLNWNTPQALNNWGLALQELSAIVPAREKQTIVKSAIKKFRGAIALQFDFHRAIYNLGTVLYGLAEDISRMGGSSSIKDVSPDELYSLSAIYIAAAHALRPSYSVYTSALKLVRSMLPLPYLKVGYLTAPPVGVLVAPHSDWRRTQFVLDNEGLQQIHRVEQHMSSSLSGRSGDIVVPAVRVDVADIVSVAACADLTLPPGPALCIDTIHGPVYLIADSWESLEGWLDAMRLVYTIFARGKSEVLASIVAG